MTTKSTTESTTKNGKTRTVTPVNPKNSRSGHHSRPAAAREFSDVPYGGLFGDTVMARVVEEIVADPHAVYHLKDLEDLTGNSAPRIREALGTLTGLGLLKSSGGKHPAYTVNTSRRSFVALTLLAYAVLDDREGSDCMDTAVRHYCETRAPASIVPDIPLTLPEDVHRIVKAHNEIRWGEIARRAIGDYAKKIERIEGRDPTGPHSTV